MERFQVLLLLALLVSMVSRSIHSVQVFGEYTTDDPKIKLGNLQAEKLRLEAKLANTESGEEKNLLRMNLINADYWIRQIQDTSKVLYKDYLQMMVEKKAELEKEKADRMKQLEKQKELTKEKDQLANEYVKYIETQLQNHMRLRTEKEQLIRERDEVMQKLKEAQNLHSQALEAIAVTTQEGYKLVTIPHQNDIKHLRDKMTALVNEGNENQLIGDFLATQKSLTNLLETLYEESELSTNTAYKDLEMDLAKMEIQSVQTKAKHDNRGKEIFQNMKNKELGDYTKEEIMSLQQANKEAAETQKRLQQIARQNAYLKAISQVNFLIEECAMVIKYAEEKKALRKSRLGNFLAERKGLQRMISLDSARKQDIDLKALASLPITQSPPDGQGEKGHVLDSHEEAESMHDIIHEKGLLYKDLLELYRTKLSTEIMNGLAKINKRLPIPFPGCGITRLIELRDALNKWAERVQYATRLSKHLHKYDTRSMILRFFSTFLETLRNAFITLVGNNVSKKNDIQDDDELTSSIEKFNEENRDDFSKYYQYVKVHLRYLLDINADLSSEYLREFRYNFIFVKKSPDVLASTSQRILEEKRHSPTEEMKQLKTFSRVLEEMDISSERLSLLFTVLISRVKSTIEKQDRAYQAALKEYQECRHALVQNLPLFRNMNNKQV